MRMADMFRIPRMYQDKKYLVRRGTNQTAGMLRLPSTCFRSEHRRACLVEFRRLFRQSKAKYRFGRTRVIENY